MSEKTKSHRAAKTTIVGGQPPGNDRDLTTVPVGLEELLGMAAVDDAFAEALLTDPVQTVEASGVTLTATEQAILGALDRAALEPMIARIADRLPEPERRAFLEQATAAVVVLVGGGAALGAAGCKEGNRSTTAEKKEPKGRKPTPREAVDTGARPDRPEAQPDRPKPQPVTGVRPDRPPVRPDAGVKPRERPRPTVKNMRPNRGTRPRRTRPDLDTRITGISPDRPPLRKVDGDNKDN